MSDPYNAIERISILSSALKDVAAAYAQGGQTSEVAQALAAMARLLLQLTEAAANPTTVVRP